MSESLNPKGLYICTNPYCVEGLDIKRDEAPKDAAAKLGLTVDENCDLRIGDHRINVTTSCGRCLRWCEHRPAARTTLNTDAEPYLFEKLTLNTPDTLQTIQSFFDRLAPTTEPQPSPTTPPTQQ